MPNASGFLTSREVMVIRRMAFERRLTSEIADAVGCHEKTVHIYTGNLSSMIKRAEQYNRIATNAAAYVPTFGGGR